MPFTQVQFPQFCNFTAALRKPMLINSAYFSPNQQTSWIASLVTGGGGAGTQTNFVQSPDGTRTVFTPTVAYTSAIYVFLNGSYQDISISYSLAGGNVVFTTAPQSTDDLTCIVF